MPFFLLMLVFVGAGGYLAALVFGIAAQIALHPATWAVALAVFFVYAAARAVADLIRWLPGFLTDAAEILECLPRATAWALVHGWKPTGRWIAAHPFEFLRLSFIFLVFGGMAAITAAAGFAHLGN